jgi:hypothetical protein
VNIEGLTGKLSNKNIKYYEDCDGDIVAKTCSICNKVKELSDFAKNSSGLGLRRSTCKSCRAVADRKYHEQNRDKRNHYNRNYREANREHMVELSRNWRKQNSEQMSKLNRHWREQNTERMAELNRNWRIKNHDRALVLYQRRRARKKLLPDNFTSEQMATTLGFFRGCALTDSAEIQWDHVIPLTTGRGGTIFGNMIPLRADLNLSKNASNIFEWFSANQQRFNLEQERFDRLIEWLGKANGMTVEEYRDYVYECHANPNVIDDAKAN